MELPPLYSGIYELMSDLGKGLNDPDTLMLGGGNPAIMKSTRDFFSPILQKTSDNSDFFRKAFQSYSHPQGEEGFVNTVSSYFHKATGWSLTPDNVCITQGSQQGFYMLYNYLIGRFHSEIPPCKPVLVTIKSPDYIGYFDLIPRDNFLSVDGEIEFIDDQTFKYHIDFSALEKLLEKDGYDYDIKALVISSPNNPSSHILSQADTDQLCRLAEYYDKIIIFDHAYGFPFPNIIFGKKTNYPFTSQTLHCFSFSKIGLPGIRTGIMIGSSDLIEKMIILNGIVNLAPSSLTCSFLEEVLRSPGFDSYIKDSLYPNYTERKNITSELFRQKLRGTPALIHQPQGGFFLWLRAPNFSLSSYRLYQEIKSQKVVVVPGNYFFLHEPTDGAAYLRISFTMEEDRVLRGLEIIAETIKKYYTP